MLHERSDCIGYAGDKRWLYGWRTLDEERSSLYSAIFCTSEPARDKTMTSMGPRLRLVSLRDALHPSLSFQWNRGDHMDRCAARCSNRELEVLTKTPVGLINAFD